jgi:hypothetical protein
MASPYMPRLEHGCGKASVVAGGGRSLGFQGTRWGEKFGFVQSRRSFDRHRLAASGEEVELTHDDSHP